MDGWIQLDATLILLFFKKKVQKGFLIQCFLVEY